MQGLASPIGASSYADGAVSNGVTYYYVVTAIDTSGNESGQSGEASATPSGGGDTTPPAAPSGLSSSADNNSITLNWNDNGEADLAGYRVYRSTNRNGPYDQVGGLVTASTYDDAAVQSRQWYYYFVTAVDTSGNESATSGMVRDRVR